MKDFRWSVVLDNWLFLLLGLGRSWLYGTAAIAIGMLVGTIIATGRVYGNYLLRLLAAVYVDCVRGTPHLMVILGVFFVYPEVSGINLDTGTTGIVALSIIASAYLAEVVRAGLQSVNKIQAESAFATGLKGWEIFMYVVLPQALRNMLPAFVATFILIFKTSSFLYVIGIVEFFHAGNIVNTRDVAPYAVYTTIAIGYFISCYVLSRIIYRLDPKYTLVG